MTATVDMRGAITFTDLIFTNLSDPTDTGFISVSANLVADWISDGPTNVRMISRPTSPAASTSSATASRPQASATC